MQDMHYTKIPYRNGRFREAGHLCETRFAELYVYGRAGVLGMKKRICSIRENRKTTIVVININN